jgi:cold-inducible RNA-binding protein
MIMGKKLYVGNLSFNVDSATLEQLFATYGTVQSANVIKDRSTGQSKGFGFVEMSSNEEAKAAIAALDGKDHGGRALKVNEAKPQEERGRGDRGGYGRGGRRF